MIGKKIDFLNLRRRMVEEQLRTRDIVDERVLEAMGKVPREEFVPEEERDRAYEDRPLPISQKQTISQPYIVALMTQLLKLSGGGRVLEIGTGSGYQAAVLSYLTGRIYSIERHPELAKQAQKIFKDLKIENIVVKVGDGSKGWQEEAPFEAIIITAAAEKIPQALIDQLTEGGRLVAPVGKGYWQELIRITKKNGKLEEENFGGCAFVPLVSNEVISPGKAEDPRLSNRDN